MLKQCPGCKASFPYDENLILPTFGIIRYGVSSPECQSSFNEILAKERLYFGYPPAAHR